MTQNFEFKAKKDSGVMVLVEDIEELLQNGKSFTITPIKAKHWSPEELEVLSRILAKYLKKYNPDRLDFSSEESEGEKGTITGISKAISDGKMAFASWGKEKDPKIPHLLRPDRVVALTPTVFYLNT